MAREAKKVTAPVRKTTPGKQAAAKPATKKTSAAAKSAVEGKTRGYLSQEDVPAYSLKEALRVPQALVDHYGSGATAPIDVASALDLTPGSSIFRMLCGAALAYGLTDGSAQASAIAPTEIAKRILSPVSDIDVLAAKREAVMKPRVIKEFLTKYSGNAVPRPDIGQKVLQQLGVPEAKTNAVWDLLIDTAQEVGYIRTIKEKLYVHLGSAGGAVPVSSSGAPENLDPAGPIPEPAFTQSASDSVESAAGLGRGGGTPTSNVTSQNKKVFITHGKNMAFIEPIKKLLGFGEMIPVVSVERQSVSMPVPDKVMNDMRDCAAAIIHVDGEQRLMDQEANEHTVINPNVLIEIGAAMALYGRRFILLVRDGVKLPSNLQGLYEVRYQGDSLDGNVTIKLFEAISAMKSTPLPLPA